MAAAFVLSACRTPPLDPTDAGVGVDAARRCPCDRSFQCTTTAHGPQTIAAALVMSTCEFSDGELLLRVSCNEDGTLGSGASAMPGGTWSFDGQSLRASISWCVEGEPPNCVQQTDSFVCDRP